MVVVQEERMPIYEYACPVCGRFEQQQLFSDPPLTTCPSGHTGVERLISSSVGFAFKGTGFYITDYQRKGEAKDEGSGASSKEGESGSGDKKESGSGSASTSASSAGSGEKTPPSSSSPGSTVSTSSSGPGASSSSGSSSPAVAS